MIYAAYLSMLVCGEIAKAARVSAVGRIMLAAQRSKRNVKFDKREARISLVARYASSA